MPLHPGKRLGPYEVLGLIGAGGTGEVYKARGTCLDRIVALKILPRDFAAYPQRRQRFEREAKTISALNHSHIRTLYDIEIMRRLNDCEAVASSRAEAG